jgi:hypothetical protein
MNANEFVSTPLVKLCCIFHQPATEAGRRDFLGFSGGSGRFFVGAVLLSLALLLFVTGL